MHGISPAQLTEWEAFYRLEPWGDDWVQNARLEAAIKNQYLTDPVQPADLVPNEDNKERTGEVEDSQLGAVWKQRLKF